MMKLTLVFLPSVFLLQTATAQQVADRCESLGRERQVMESQLHDWPNLAKYREANAKLGVPVQGETRVVFLGDSITEAWDLSVFFKGKPYVNRGIRGQTTPQILLRFRQDVIALKPGIVVVLAGTNDIAQNTGPTSLGTIEDNLKSISSPRSAAIVGATSTLETCRSRTPFFMAAPDAMKIACMEESPFK